MLTSAWKGFLSLGHSVSDAVSRDCEKLILECIEELYKSEWYIEELYKRADSM